MGRDTYGFASLNLLLVVLVFGLLLLPWSELWWKPVVRDAAAKGSWLLKPKTGRTVGLSDLPGGAGGTMDEGNATVLLRPWRQGVVR